MHRICILSLALTALPATAAAGNEASITDLSIEELMNVEVVSVSKKPQKLVDAAAAVFVISADDIHRSGAQSLPEVLRPAPGVDVAWIGGEAYSVSIRGFGGRFSNKLLVLEDGRSLYTSMFAGVFWEKELPMLEDIERIEVIRGPGAASWGANAVNGVVNIITRSSRETVGGLVALQSGSEKQRNGALRIGARINDDSTFRVYARGALADPGVAREQSDLMAEAASENHLNNASGGVRYDHAIGANRISVQAEGFRAYTNQPVLAPSPAPPYLTEASESQEHRGGFAVAHWERSLDNGAGLSLQTSYSESRAKIPGVVYQSRRVFDLDFQHHLAPLGRSELMWGLSLRRDADSIQGSQILEFTPPTFVRTTVNLMLQDEIAIVPNKLHLTIGAVVEHDSIIGTHAMPDARLAWNVSPTTTVWSAVSRALRSPSRAERDVQFLIGPSVPAQPPFSPLPIVPTVTGTTQFAAETETAYQLGYRIQPTRDLSIDIAGYLSRYSNLRAYVPDFAGIHPALLGQVPYLRLPLNLVNGNSATSRGVELSVDWRPASWWRVVGSASHIKVTSSLDNDFEGTAGSTPSNAYSLRSSMDLHAHLRFDVALRHSDSRLLSGGGGGGIRVPGYNAVDLRIAWTVAPALEIAFGARNLLSGSHLEYVPDAIVTVPRAVAATGYAAVRLSF